MNKYRTAHPSELQDKKAKLWNPKIPYVQNL